MMSSMQKKNAPAGADAFSNIDPAVVPG